MRFLLLVLFLSAGASDDDMRLAGVVGDRIGLRRVGSAYATGGAEFWVAARVAGPSAADDGFAGVSQSLWWRGEWSTHESAFASAVMRQHCESAIVVDGGAYVGYFTMLAQAHGCRTLSVEPVQQSLDAIRLGLAVNGFRSRLEQAFIADKPTSTTTTLDALLEDEEQDIAYLKLDLEGGELLALAAPAAQRTLKRTRVAMIELTLRGKCGSAPHDADLAVLLLRLRGDFDLYRLEEVGEPQPGRIRKIPTDAGSFLAERLAACNRNCIVDPDDFCCQVDVLAVKKNILLPEPYRSHIENDEYLPQTLPKEQGVFREVRVDDLLFLEFDVEVHQRTFPVDHPDHLLLSTFRFPVASAIQDPNKAADEVQSTICPQIHIDLDNCAALSTSLVNAALATKKAA